MRLVVVMAVKRFFIRGLFFCSIALVVLLAIGSDVEAVSFEDWLTDIRQQARERGFSESTLRTLENLEPDPRVLRFDRKQPEFVQTFEEYLTARVTPYRILTARLFYQDEKETLEEIALAYDVDAQYLLAFWGLESNFGKYQGKYSIVRSLATLGHDPRRSTFFTRELFNALQILDEGHISSEQFVGGWAGAMGQNQFMPSSFLNYAQDFDGDGKKNIWNSQQDVWASIANYLKKHRWRRGEIWGLSVNLTQTHDFDLLRPEKVRSGCRAYRHHTRVISVQEWKKMGVEFDGDPGDDMEFAMVIPDAGEDRAYLVGPNFGKILSYNCANKYAVSIGLMADEISG
ncbi:MAG: lytic murein transglycosylase [bacterium]|nr:lytic murein transglycosylase [Gammaproteobacteria bacterium]HIL99259.1 lytic murein transglycosylase [Pseudomonadales bacterium]